jgi:hypothetical protein
MPSDSGQSRALESSRRRGWARSSRAPPCGRLPSASADPRQSHATFGVAALLHPSAPVRRASIRPPWCIRRHGWPLTPRWARWPWWMPARWSVRAAASDRNASLGLGSCFDADTRLVQRQRHRRRAAGRAAWCTPGP